MSAPSADLLARRRGAASVRARAPLRVLAGFGGALRAAGLYAAPRSVGELVETLSRARHEGLAVALRGSGRSYGDAAISTGGLVVDTSRLDRMLSWDPVRGVVEAEPGLTIEGLWRRTLVDGWWPAVVPGTMRPTLGGCLAMNVHGKNNYAVGPIGDHVLDFDLVTPGGTLVRASRVENADLFHAAIGGLGLLGAFTRVRLQMKRVESGRLRVEPIATRDLDETLDVFESRLGESDYLVGWLDGLARGAPLGRSVLHAARYLTADEDPDGERSYDVERQSLPARILGFPRSLLWRFMRPFVNDVGVRFVNALKMLASRLSDRRAYTQSHVAFAFLLDYVPEWRRAYGRHGFIQHQVFIPKESARATLRALLELSHARGLPSYLCVLKRHRPDAFLLSHAVDGWSLAMDFPVTAVEQGGAVVARCGDDRAGAGRRRALPLRQGRSAPAGGRPARVRARAGGGVPGAQEATRSGRPSRLGSVAARARGAAPALVRAQSPWMRLSSLAWIESFALAPWRESFTLLQRCAPRPTGRHARATSRWAIPRRRWTRCSACSTPTVCSATTGACGPTWRSTRWAITSTGGGPPKPRPPERTARPSLRGSSRTSPDHVHVVAGNHDLARTGELATFDDATFRDARAQASPLCTRAATRRVNGSSSRALPRAPDHAELAARDFASFTTVAQRDLVARALRAARLRAAFAWGQDILLTHAGGTVDNLVRGRRGPRSAGTARRRSPQR